MPLERYASFRWCFVYYCKSSIVIQGISFSCLNCLSLVKNISHLDAIADDICNASIALNPLYCPLSLDACSAISEFISIISTFIQSKNRLKLSTKSILPLEYGYTRYSPIVIAEVTTCIFFSIHVVKNLFITYEYKGLFSR